MGKWLLPTGKQRIFITGVCILSLIKSGARPGHAKPLSSLKVPDWLVEETFHMPFHELQEFFLLFQAVLRIGAMSNEHMQDREKRYQVTFSKPRDAFIVRLKVSTEMLLALCNG